MSRYVTILSNALVANPTDLVEGEVLETAKINEEIRSQIRNIHPVLRDQIIDHRSV